MAALIKRLSLRASGGSKKSASAEQKAFSAELSEEALSFFNDVAAKPFSQQAVAFLNAYWDEIGDQAEFIFEMAYDVIKYADMHCKGVSFIHLYDEGTELDFNIGLYFYEQLCKRVLTDEKGAKWREDPKFKASMPEMMTAIVRKKELREKVDVNFDNKISFLEYLLYQYREFTNPAEFTKRGMAGSNGKEHPMVLAARLALEDVNARIRAYEEEKARLEALKEAGGVKGLGATHQLAALISSPLAEELQVALIKAEAALRAAIKASNAERESGQSTSSGPNAGALWWMNRDLEEKKKLYGKR